MTRWKPTGDGGMEPSPTGAWVRVQEIAQRDARITELEAAFDKLAQCKGRYHTEANFKVLIEVRNKTLHK